MEPACDPPAPTTVHPESAQDRRPAYAGSYAREPCTPTSGRRNAGFAYSSAAGKCPLRHQVLCAVKILQQQVQQLGALNDACLDKPPLVRRNQQRDNIDLPRAIRSQWIAIDVVGDSVLANAALSAAPAAAQLLRANLSQRLHQVRPVRPRRHAISRQLVIRSSVAERSLIQIESHGTSPGLPWVPCCPESASANQGSSGKSGWSLPPAPRIGPDVGPTA